MPTVRTNDVATYYEREGEGPPVVMAHGAGYDHRWWEPQVEALRDDYELTTYDLRGHGRTGGGGNWRSYPMQLYALDLHRLIEALDLDRPVVVGHSLGGMFLPAFATTYPDATRGLVLADAQVTDEVGLRERLVGNVLTPALILTNRLFGLDRAQQVAEAVGRLLADEDDPEPEIDDALAAYQESVQERQDRPEMTRIQRGLRRFEGARLEELSVPTLGVYADLKRDLMADNAAALVGRAPDAEIEEVSDAGHLFTWTEPEAFNEALRGFLERVYGEG